MTLNKISSSRLTRLYILFSSIIFTVIILSSYWSKFSINQMWFDEGFNYYVTAKNTTNFLAILMRDDSGYLNTLPRLISLLLVRVMDVNAYFPAIFKAMNTFVFCFMMSLLLSKRFDTYFGKNLFVRFSVLTLCVLFPHQDLSYPFNSSYGLIVPALYISINIFENTFISNARLFFYFLVFPIIFISKIPISLFGVALFSYGFVKLSIQKNYKLLLLTIWGAVCSSTEILFYILNFKDVYIDSGRHINIVHSLLNIIGIGVSIVGISVTGFVFKCFNNTSELFEIIALILGCAFISFVFFTLFDVLKKRQYCRVQMLVFLTLMIAITSGLLSINRSYPGTWDMLFLIGKYFIHRHVWLGYVATLLLLLLLSENAKSIKVISQSYLIIIAIISIFSFPHINRYPNAITPLQTSAQDDLSISDWINAYKIPALTKIILTNNYNAVSTSPPMHSLGFYRLNNDMQPILFSTVINMPRYASFTGSQLLLIIKINGLPSEIQQLEAVIKFRNGRQITIKPLYYPTVTRFYAFDLGDKIDPSQMQYLNVRSQGEVKDGWYDFMVYKTSK